MGPALRSAVRSQGGCCRTVAASPGEARAEWLRCSLDAVYFTLRYVHIYNATAQAWLPFALWPAQVTALRTIAAERLLVILKARQLGLSWLCLAYALWLMLVQAPSTVLLFSLREAEAVELLTRLKGMYVRLPRWLQARRVMEDAATRWRLSNGSQAIALSTRGDVHIRRRWRWWMRRTMCPIWGTFLVGSSLRWMQEASCWWLVPATSGSR